MTKCTCLLIGFMTTSLAIPCRAKNTHQTATWQVNVRVFDLAGVPPELLRDAQEQARLIFRSTGVALSWIQGSPLAAEAYELDYRGQENGAASTRLVCGTTLEVCQIDLRLVALGLRHLKPGELARALPFAHSGVRVTIFYDRVQRILDRHGNLDSKLLGHVMAHEIGHVLLVTDRHSSGGLMRASWNDADFETMARVPMLLTAEQIRSIQESLRARLALRAAADPSHSGPPQVTDVLVPAK